MDTKQALDIAIDALKFSLLNSVMPGEYRDKTTEALAELRAMQKENRISELDKQYIELGKLISRLKPITFVGQNYHETIIEDRSIGRESYIHTLIDHIKQLETNNKTGDK